MIILLVTVNYGRL